MCVRSVDYLGGGLFPPDFEFPPTLFWGEEKRKG